MASDEIVWGIINQGFCSFKLKSNKGMNFCRNEHNVDGRCNRQSCPLANSRYATVRSNDQGVLYLYIKTVERAHLPSKLWEKIKLSANYHQALEQIDERLIYFPKYLLHKCKQRATRIFQVNTRMRRLAKEDARIGEKLVPRMAPKIRRREETRERKAETAAKLEKTIERELIERLRQGAYGDQPLNVSETIWRKVLNAMEKEGEGARDKDLDKGIEDEEEDESEAEVEYDEEGNRVDAQVEYISDFDESDEELDDIEDWLASDNDDDEEDDDEDEDSDDTTEKKTKGKAGDKRKRGRVIRMKSKKRREIETEQEGEKLKVLA